MSVTINAKGTSTTSFKVGKDGTIITQGGVISPPAGAELSFNRGGPPTATTMTIGVNGNVVINTPVSGDALSVNGTSKIDALPVAISFVQNSGASTSTGFKPIQWLTNSGTFTSTGASSTQLVGAAINPSLNTNATGGSSQNSVYGLAISPNLLSSTATAYSSIVGVSVNSHRGNTNDISTNASNFVYGVSSSAGHVTGLNPATTSASALALLGNTRNDVATITLMSGVRGQIVFFPASGATASTTDAVCLDSNMILAGVAGGTANITNLYGLRLRSPTIGPGTANITNRYGVSSEDASATNVFAGPITASGGITGSLTGAASLNVLKSGDTMTGDLTMSTTGRVISSLIDLQLEAANGYTLKLNTGGTARVWVDNSGNVGIGMTPTYPLDVNGLIRNAAYGVPTFTLGPGTINTWNIGTLSQNTTSFDGSGKVTIGLLSSPKVTINTAASFGNILGSYSYGTVDSTLSGSTGAVYGSYGNAQRSNANDQSTVFNAVYGAFGSAIHSNTLPATASTVLVAGVFGNAALAAGTVTNTLTSFYGNTNINTGASVLNISVPSVSLYDGVLTIGSTSSGTTAVTNLYGLRLRSPTINSNVTITNRYGISSEDASATNVFAGSVIVNSTTNAGIGSGADIFAAGGNIGFTSQLNANPGSGNFLEIVNRSTGGIKLYTNAGAVVALTVSTAGVLTDLNGKELGLKNIPPNSNTWVRGECNVITSGATIGTSNAGDVYSVYNDSSSSVTLTASGITLRLGGTTTSGNRTLLPYGFATVWFQSSTVAVINGNVT